MNILDFTREQVKALGELKFNSKSTLHYDVCLDLKRGMPVEAVKEKYGFFESRTVTWIKANKCTECNR